jgi:pyruvate-ferredoxin/flavodoxin oxidoreductase
LPNTPARFFDDSTTPDGDIKRLLLDRANYYATTGGHGGCRGCGEVTALRLVMSMSHALGDKRRRTHLRELDSLLTRLQAKLDSPQVLDPGRRARIASIIETLDRRLYLYEDGPTGNGPSSTVIANSTGCSSVYASTMPFNSYVDPWVNSLFQDAQPLAKGIFEGICAQVVSDIRALRLAQLELDDAYHPATHDKELRMLSWGGFTPGELGLLPTVMTVGGDGANYDIGFGAMSRVLASDTPIKMIVLNSGVYSNTGGQTSTSSFTAQDSDLSRFGSAGDGKHEHRKELGLLASFHPNVFVCATSTAFQSHFLTSTMELLNYTTGPAVMDVYTPCGSEHGIPEAASNARARLAVESRMNPLFVHDPRLGTSLNESFSIEGNPDPDRDWTTTTLQYVDDAGLLQLMTTPLTPAEFALGEVRFKKQFRTLAPELEAVAVPIDEYVDLPGSQRDGRVPFIYATDQDRHLTKVACSASIVALVDERRRYWHTLQYLTGEHETRLSARHRSDIEALQAQYDQAMQQRETSLDDIARAMSDLAASSGAPAGFGGAVPTGLSPGAGTRAAVPSAPAAAVGVLTGPVYLDPADEALCNDCGTCYQELPQFFEKATVIIDGTARTIARMVPGAAEGVEVTPELRKRIDRVRATCDAEIIR